MSFGDFIADGGPEFDPDQMPDEPDVDAILDVDELPVDEGWKVEQVRDLLITQGNATNWLLRLQDDDESWKHTEDDLRAISGPLARILNRYDASRAAAAAGDEIALGAAIFNYGARNYQRRRRLIALRQQTDRPQPVTGVPAPPGTGPESDEDWQRVMSGPPAITPKGPHR